MTLRTATVNTEECNSIPDGVGSGAGMRGGGACRNPPWGRQQQQAHPSNGGPQTQYMACQQSQQPFQKKEKQEWSILRLSVKKQGILEDILELGSFLSLSGSPRSPNGRGRGGG